MSAETLSEQICPAAAWLPLMAANVCDAQTANSPEGFWTNQSSATICVWNLWFNRLLFVVFNWSTGLTSTVQSRRSVIIDRFIPSLLQTAVWGEAQQPYKPATGTHSNRHMWLANVQKRIRKLIILVVPELKLVQNFSLEFNFKITTHTWLVSCFVTTKTFL